MLPRCLVLLASRNGEAHLPRQLSSVFSQVGVEVVVDVRDDQSNDSTRSLIAELVQQDKPLRLRTDHSATGSAAGNFFRLILEADVASFGYVAFCDQDDEWSPGKLARAIDCLSGSAAVGYSSGVEAIWPDGSRKPLMQSSAIRAADYLFEGAGQGCTFVIKAAFFQELQSLLRLHQKILQRIHYHDWTLYALARALGRQWYFDQRLTMHYLQHSSNDTGARNSSGGVVRRLKLIQQGWYKAQVDAIVDLVLAVKPDEQSALAWRVLAKPARWGALRRLCFVSMKGRRRVMDRFILACAVIGGYL